VEVNVVVMELEQVGAAKARGDAAKSPALQEKL
jgi:hypothetical protein